MKHEEFLKQVKELALVATPGPWNTEITRNHQGQLNKVCVVRGITIYGGGHAAKGNDAEFIAAANPQAVLKLLAIIEKLKVQRYRMLAEKYAGFPNQAMNEDTILDAELDEIVGMG